MPAALFALAISLRLIYLSADPPSWIRLSMAMETDPPVYTVYTRSDILTGDWIPMTITGLKTRATPDAPQHRFA